MFGSIAPFRRSFALSVATLFSAGALIVLAGCGGDGLGKRYPVSGTVTYKGEPLSSGTINFYAVGEGTEAAARGAFGVIENGSYTLSTQGEDDGAFPGEYLVSIMAREVDMTKAQENAKGGSARQDDVAKAYATAKRLIPEKYEVPENSGLKATVKAQSNSLDFELTD